MVKQAGRFFPLVFAIWVSVLGFFAGQASARAVATVAGPKLRFVSLAGYRLGVTGYGWHHGARIRFSVHEGAIVEGFQLRPTAAGRFTVGIRDISVCTQPFFDVRESDGARAVLHGPPLACPAPLTIPKPRLRLLSGRTAEHAIVRIFGSSPNAVSLHLGDELYIWESGSAAPAWRPHVDSAFLAVLRRATTSAGACSRPDCADGYYWDFVATKAGESAVDLAASCLDSPHPCAIRDLEIRVSIVP